MANELVVRKGLIVPEGGANITGTVTFPSLLNGLLRVNGTGVVSVDTAAYITLASTITGYAVGANSALAASDTLLAALGKIQGQLNAKQASGSYEPTITAGTTAQYWRGDKTWQTLNTAAVTESTNLYFTEGRVLGSTLAGFAVGVNTAVTSSDTVLSAFGKIQAQLNAHTTAQGTFVLKAGDTMTGNLTVPALIVGGSTGATLNAGVAALAAGTNTVLSVAKAGFSALFIDYVVYNTGKTNQRSGTVVINNNGTAATFNETTTTDMGTTSAITTDVVVGASNVDFKLLGVPDATYTVKVIYRYI